MARKAPAPAQTRDNMLSFRIPEGMRTRLDRLIAVTRRSITAECVLALEEHFDRMAPHMDAQATKKTPERQSIFA